MQKELNTHLSIYMEHKGDQTKEELDSKFYKLLDKFCDDNGMTFQIYNSEVQGD